MLAAVFSGVLQGCREASTPTEDDHDLHAGHNHSEDDYSDDIGHQNNRHPSDCGRTMTIMTIMTIMTTTTITRMKTTTPCEDGGDVVRLQDDKDGLDGMSRRKVQERLRSHLFRLGMRAEALGAVFF